jgi:hypothetical protein
VDASDHLVGIVSRADVLSGYGRHAALVSVPASLIVTW